MSTPIVIRLLICMVVFLPSCCRGLQDPCKSQDHRIHDLCEQALEINSTNWYQNLKIHEVNEEIQQIVKKIEKRTHSENYLSDINRLIIGSPFHGQFIDSKPSEEGHSVSRNAEIIIEVTRSLKDKYCLKHRVSDVQCAKDLTNVKLTKTTLGEMCSPDDDFDTLCVQKYLIYRSPDGSCNNKNSSSLGKATLPYKRLLFPVYTDGIYDMSEELPNPRQVSSDLVKDENWTDDTKTMMMAYWTIFIGHDLSHTAVSTMGDNKFVKCCYTDGRMQYKLNKHLRSCKPIFIPDDDKYFMPGPRRCMNYVRSRTAVHSSCTFGPIEQMNQATHYLDGSMIYGSSLKQTLSLRKMSGGELLTNTLNTNQNYMPLETTVTDACQYGNGTCFRAGDIRANTFPQLTALHTLWVREHNRVARGLAYLNPHWKDEHIFLESKKIVTAFIQHITYNEWLPALLGVDYTKKNGLGLLEVGYSNTYDETADPSVSNSFATAILPFANSMISDTIGLYAENQKEYVSHLLKDHHNRPVDLLVTYMDQIVKELTIQSTQKVDMLFTQTITNNLYSQDVNNWLGMDIVSLDIQRSRDHGIPSYTEFRKYCGLKDIENEYDLFEIMENDLADKVLEHYDTLDDIDLLVGALLEKHAEDAMVGPTMRCIIREQFVRTKTADRYFYDLPGVFSKNQLKEIRKMTLARIICNNINDITMMQKQVFLKPNLTNELQPCNTELIPTTFISHWLDFVTVDPKSSRTKY